MDKFKFFLISINKERETDTCGTLKSSRKTLPKQIRSAKIEKGEINVYHHSSKVMTMKLRDKRILTLLSTDHSHEVAKKKNKSGKYETNPILGYDYNKEMGNADLTLYSFLVERKRGTKWYDKI